jgi:hypothetical protein
LRKALHVAENWALHKVDQKYRESSEMWYWRRIEKVSWTDRVRSELLHGAKEERNIYKLYAEGRLTGLVTSCVGTAF